MTIEQLFFIGLLIVAAFINGYCIGHIRGYDRGADESRAIWKSCLDDVRNIYRPR